MNEQPQFSQTALHYLETRNKWAEAVSAVNTSYGEVSQLTQRARFGNWGNDERTVRDSVKDTAAWLDKMTAMIATAKALGEELAWLADQGHEARYNSEEAARWEWAKAEQAAKVEAEFEARYLVGITVSYSRSQNYWLLHERTADGGALLVRNNYGKRVSKRVSKNELGYLLTHGVNNFHLMNDLAVTA